MRISHSMMGPLLRVTFVALAYSCASVSSWSELDRLPTAAPRLQRAMISQVCESADRGEYGRALRLIQQELDQGTSERRLAEPYVRSLNGLLEQAEKRHLNDDPRAAGVLFRKTLDYYPTSKPVRRAVAMRVAEVEAAVDVCADTLLAEGLTAYRAGQLQEAIDIWAGIEEFHPDHDQSQQAIETTRVQLETLRELAGQ